MPAVIALVLPDFLFVVFRRRAKNDEQKEVKHRTAVG
jgi:hypothetical protein